MKEPKLTADFGPEVTSADFAKLLAEVEQPDPYTIKKDEYAYFTRSTNIADQIYQLDKRWAYTVTNKTEVGNDYVFNFVREVREYDREGKEKISQDQSSVRLEKRTTNNVVYAKLPEPVVISPMTLASIHGSTLGSLVTMNGDAETMTDQPTPRVTFHNADLHVGHMPVPDFVQQRTDCGGLSAEKCRGALKTFTLTYDQVIWDGDQGQRYAVSWVFSPDVPYFASTMFPNPAGVIQACSSTYLPYQGQRIKVTQCDEIKDFTFGKDD